MPMAAVAERLGISLQTFRSWRAHHIGPRGYKLGGKVQYRWSEVEAWLQQQKDPEHTPAQVQWAASRYGRVGLGKGFRG